MDFDMVTTSELHSEEIVHIESLYDLTIKNSFFLGEGSGNTNYYLETDKGCCVFSIIEEQSVDDVEVMAKVLNWLEKYQIKTSLLIKPKSQEHYSVKLRGKHSLLRTYMDGAVCQELNSHMLRQVGVAIAQLHAIPIPDFLPDFVFYEQKKFFETLDVNLVPEYERWAKRRLKELCIESINGLPKSLIHSDLFYDNMLFEGERFVSMIDFELTCVYHSVFDIAMAIVGVCGTNGVLSLEKAQHLIFGYQSQRMLKREEIHVLKRYTEYAAILTSLWRYWRYNVYEPGGNKVDRYQEMVSMARSVEKADFSKIIDKLSR